MSVFFVVLYISIYYSEITCQNMKMRFLNLKKHKKKTSCKKQPPTKSKPMILLSLMFACGDAQDTSNPTPKIQNNTQVEQKKSPPKMGAAPQKKSNPSASSGSCDQQLKDYSDIVDEYIDLMKKANNGDLSALQKYPNLLKKAEKSGKELEVLHKDGKIDAACWKKYNAINNRMSEAAMDMSGASAEDKKELKELQKANDKAVDQAACLQNCQTISDPMQQSTCITGCM